MPNDFISEDDLDTFRRLAQISGCRPQHYRPVSMAEHIRRGHQEPFSRRRSNEGSPVPPLYLYAVGYVIMAFGSSCGSHGLRIRSSP